MTIRYLPSYFTDGFLALARDAVQADDRERRDAIIAEMNRQSPMKTSDALETARYQLTQPAAFKSTQERLVENMADSDAFFEKNRAWNRTRVEIAAAALNNAHAERDDAIREAKEAGVPIKQIAEAAGMTRQSIYTILGKK